MKERAAPPAGAGRSRRRTNGDGEVRRSVLMALPGMGWLFIFFLLPVLFVIGASFFSRGVGGVPTPPLTLDHYERTFDVFGGIIWRSLGYALISTFVCLLIGYPVAWFIAQRRSPGARMLLLFLVLLPFWTNFLVRTYALITILQREGLLNGILLRMGITSEPLQMMFTEGAVILGLIYGYLPFMILPIYASVERLDKRYVEAAFDLGANDWRTFWRVIFPLTLPGVIAGSMLVFIPTIGAFVTPDLMGGTRGLMIGNLIQSQFGGRGNMPLGSAISVVLLLIVFIGVIIYSRHGEERR